MNSYKTYTDIYVKYEFSIVNLEINFHLIWAFFWLWCFRIFCVIYFGWQLKN